VTIGLILELPEDGSGTAVRLEERREGIEFAARLLDCQLVVVTTRELLDPASDAQARLAPTQVAWWLGRITFLEESRSLAARVSEIAPQLRLIDAPEAVEQAYNLSLSYPHLARAGLPQPKTRFVALTPKEAAGTKDELARLFARRLRWRWVRESFFRTYYGTRKLHPGLNLASSKARLCEGAAELVLALRDRQEIGGLAYRELLTIEEAWTEDRSACVMLEYRVFAWGARPLFWSLDIRLDSDRRAMDEGLRAACALTGPEQLQLQEWSAKAAAALEANFLVIDFARTRERGLVLLEVNPGHSSGWGHPAAFLGVYGQVLCELAELPRRSPADLSALCAEAGYDGLETEGSLFGFFG
jgi:hypothetical protein